MAFQALSSSLYLLIAADAESLAALFWDDRRVLFDGKSFSLSRFDEEWQSLLFFPEKTLFHVTHAEALKEKELNSLIHSLSSLPSSLTLLFSSETFTLPLSLRKEIEKRGRLLDFLTEKGVLSFAMEVAKAEGVDLPSPLAKEIVSHFGKEVALLFSELKKLLLFAGEKKYIEKNDLVILSPKQEEGTLWLLGEAIFSSDIVKARTLATSLLKEGGSLISLIAHLKSQVRTAINQLSTFEKEGKEGLFSHYANIPSRLLEKKISLYHSYGKESLLSTLLHLSETELKAKNSGGEESLLLDILLTKIV